MTLTKIASNMREAVLRNGTRILISYNTPVAVRTAEGKYIKTSKAWSRTTSCHITKWAGEKVIETKEQEYFDKLFAEI